MKEEYIMKNSNILGELPKEIEEELKKYIEVTLKIKEENLKKFPRNQPNKVCYHAFLKGISIENSFQPIVKDFIPFFETPCEKIYIWTYEKDKNSCVISEVSLSVKEKPFWKSIGNLIQLALNFTESFELIIDQDKIDYKWIYYFEPKLTTIDEAVFSNLSDYERYDISNGRVLKATKISSIANIIELLIRDDKAFTSLSLLNSSFKMSYCCLLCELSEHPFHDHLTDEPQIWEHASILPDMEAAIVQACRCVEGILGEPPNRKKITKLFAFKEKVKKMLDIDLDDMFNKVGKSYLDFYYDLFFDLRNPSAHNYGNIHFDLERKKVIEGSMFCKYNSNKIF